MEKAKVVRKTDIPVQIGKDSATSARKWLSQQVPYRNFAGLHESLDQAVYSWVTAHRERFRSRMAPTMSRWATNWKAANGEAVWHEFEDDQHVPETKKAVDSKVARVEEALLEFDPIFEVENTREDLPRFKAQIIQSYTYRQMELANFRDMVQPSARDSELCNIAAIKVAWDYKEDFAVERSWELRFKEDGTPYHHDERKMRKAVVKNGVRYDLVDPFWFFYDIDAPNAQECEFIGDESEMFLHDAEAKAAAGMFSKKQMALVKSRKANGGTLDTQHESGMELPDLYRRARSIASTFGTVRETRGTNNATKLRAVECWGWFDFGDGFEGAVDPLGVKITGAHRVTATLLNGICVRFMLNPYDRKFVPYAICRPNRNGHEMAAPATFDSVVQLNAQYDLIHSNMLRQLALGTAPVIITQGDTDLPDSLLGIRPGSVLPATGNWEVIKMPDMAPQTLSYWHQYMRREIEETSGALRVFESPQGTATETERKVQEQQRMVRNSIRAVGDMLRQLALLTYWHSAQFATGPERFKVVGKASSLLGKTAMMTPDILQEDVEFRFVGVDSMHTFGSRLSGMRQWANAWGPMLASVPGVNLPALMRMDFELSVGRSNINEIFPASTPSWDSMPQEEENVMLLAGHEVPVSIHDDDRGHIEKCLPFLKDEKVPRYIRDIFIEHINEHMASMMKKEEEQKAAQKQANQQAELMAPGGGQPGVDRPPAEGGMPAQQRGTTPGPTQERTVARVGRPGNGTSQSQRMQTK